MKPILFCIAIWLITLVLSKNVKAQNVIDKISKLEKAVFSIASVDNNDQEVVVRTGFFISGDGIGIAPSNIFQNADSIVVTLRNGRTYGISRILSSHKMANLTMFKATSNRQRNFDYIIPSQESYGSKNEVLIFSHPEETEGGISLGVVINVFQAPYLDRLVRIKSDYGIKSTGAPVINNEGELIGIAGYLTKNKNHNFISTHVLNDTLWVNHPAKSYKTLTKGENKNVFNPYMNYGILNFALSNWIEAAKNFTFKIQEDSAFIPAYILRGEARRQYENYMGMRTDFEYVKENNPNHFLLHFFEAQSHIKNKEDNKAFLSLIACIEQHESYSPALVEFGLMVINLRNDIQTAAKCYNLAIHTTPLYANPYYERSRLKIQYFDDNITAMDDITMAINLDNSLPGAYAIRGTLKIGNEDYLEAISDLEKALEIDPNDTHALFNRGIAYYNLGMKEKCCKDWDTAGQLGHYKSIKYISRYCSKISLKRSNRR